MFVCCQAGLEGRGVIAELEDMVGLMDFQPNVKDYHLLAVIGTTSPGPRLNIKTVLSTYGDFHVKDKTAVRTSYL